MPTYEYACRDCGEHLEVVQSFTDDPLTVCPACEGRLRKVFSAAGIVFKGSGWHIKDYGTSKAPAAKAESNGDSEKKTEKKDAAATDGGSGKKKAATSDKKTA
jgi:putative FmdB family regulatory protein